MDFCISEDNPTIISNGLGFDIFVIMNILGIEFSVGKDSWDGKPCQWIDTFLPLHVSQSRSSRTWCRILLVVIFLVLKKLTGGRDVLILGWLRGTVLMIKNLKQIPSKDGWCVWTGRWCKHSHLQLFEEGMEGSLWERVFNHWCFPLVRKVFLIIMPRTDH